jgi:hypothetical protein
MSYDWFTARNSHRIMPIIIIQLLCLWASVNTTVKVEFFGGVLAFWLFGLFWTIALARTRWLAILFFVCFCLFYFGHCVTRDIYRS